MFLAENCFLYLHFHLDDLSLKIVVDLAISLFHKLLDVLLSENCKQLSSVWNIELFYVIIEEILK